MKHKVIDAPDFKSEREEADWWFANQHVIEQMFEEEFGPLPADSASNPVPFVAADVEGEDARLLRQQAATHGLEPHVYATRLIHEALHRHRSE